jgi:hypothetical protein
MTEEDTTGAARFADAYCAPEGVKQKKEKMAAEEDGPTLLSR